MSIVVGHVFIWMLMFQLRIIIITHVYEFVDPRTTGTRDKLSLFRLFLRGQTRINSNLQYLHF